MVPALKYHFRLFLKIVKELCLSNPFFQFFIVGDSSKRSPKFEHFGFNSLYRYICIYHSSHVEMACARLTTCAYKFCATVVEYSAQSFVAIGGEYILYILLYK